MKITTTTHVGAGDAMKHEATIVLDSDFGETGYGRGVTPDDAACNAIDGLIAELQRTRAMYEVPSAPEDPAVKRNNCLVAIVAMMRTLKDLDVTASLTLHGDEAVATLRAQGAKVSITKCGTSSVFDSAMLNLDEYGTAYVTALGDTRAAPDEETVAPPTPEEVADDRPF